MIQNLSLFEIPPCKTVSYSRLALYLDCPRRYRHVYVEGYSQYSFPTQDMRSGVAVHSALAKFFSSAGGSRSRNMLEEMLEQRLQAVYGDDVQRRDYLVSSISAAFDEEDLHSRPELVEAPFHAHLEGLCVEGRFDRVDVSDGFRRIRIVDYKVLETVKTQDEADNDLQLGIYALAASEQFAGASDMELVLMYLDRGISVVTRRSEEQMSACARRVSDIVAAIDNDTTFEARKSKYCSICNARSGCSEF